MRRLTPIVALAVLLISAGPLLAGEEQVLQRLDVARVNSSFGPQSVDFS